MTYLLTFNAYFRPQVIFGVFLLIAEYCYFPLEWRGGDNSDRPINSTNAVKGCTIVVVGSCFADAANAQNNATAREAK